MKYKMHWLDEITLLLQDCDDELLEAIYLAIWNILERGKRHERKNHPTNK